MVVEVDGIRQLELYRDGGGPNHYSHVWSVTKSVVSTLVGIAIAEGKISSLDATLPELLPDNAAQMSHDQRSITLRQLLTMSAGFSDEMGGPQLSDAKVASILKLPLEVTPGTRFIYSDPGAQLVSAIVTEATGMTTLDYARAKLFGPLGINSTPAYTGVAFGIRSRATRPSKPPTSRGRSPRMASTTGAARSSSSRPTCRRSVACT